MMPWRAEAARLGEGAAVALLPGVCLDVGAHLGAWLADHVERALGNERPPKFWQWNLAVWAWLLEMAGVHLMGRAESTRGQYEAVLEHVGIPGKAFRQLPFKHWATGDRGAFAGVGLPGAGAADGPSFDKVRRPLPADLTGWLDRWAACAVPAVVPPCRWERRA